MGESASANGNGSRPVAAGAARPAPAKATASGKAKSAKKVPFKQWWRGRTRGQKAKFIALWSAITLVGLIVLGLLAGLLYYESVELPDPNADYTTSTTTLYYRDGTTQLGALSVQNRTPLEYAEMPQTMKDAIVAAEDRTFWTNQGISLTGMARAAINVIRGESLQSGSTLTQQYIKSMYLTSAQTVSRKLKEIVLSVKITNSMSKEQILAGYLNTVYFGRGAYGIQAAAQAYFDIDAKDLSVQQAAVLASLLQGPALYDPADQSNVPRLQARYDYVIDGMVTMGTLTQSQGDAYKDNLPDFPPIQTSQTYGGPNGFLLKMVEAELATDGFTSAQIQGGGLQVTTTFDASMQAAAISSAQSFTETAATKARVPQDPALLHAAIASVGVDTGEVLALYGGPDYVTSSWNWATTPRMTGSTFKAFAFIAGERNGWGLDTILTGDPIQVPGATIYNDGNEQLGPVDLLTATQKSVNTAFVDLVQRIPDGPNQVIKAAEDAGAPAQDDQSWYPGATIPLGYAA
ncbi:MAG: penicillin-binding protein, partial [Propionibacteriaceae bacterium]|nr:penicillin-binding protein [Propionibacteriaceae bacterium]